MAQDQSETLRQFAANQVANCTLADGYVCDSITEDDFLSKASLEKLVPAIYFPAWNAAYQSFLELEELTTQQKDLKHYRIGMTESDDSYIILFSAILLPQKVIDDQAQGIGNITYGQTSKFWVDKQSLKVSKFLFYR